MHLFGYLKLLFWTSELVIFDIQNNYFGYEILCQKCVLFEISKKVILDIKNINFGYPKLNIYFGYQKELFWIFRPIITIISEVKVSVFWISKIMAHQFVISKIVIMDIRNNYNFRYPK